MNVKINETGEVKTLSVIDNRSGVNWVQDLIGNAGAMSDGQFVWSDDEGIYLADQATFDWWAKYISDTEQTEAEAEALADELDMTIDDVMDHIGENTGHDYGDHRNQAIRTMNQLRERYATQD